MHYRMGWMNTSLQWLARLPYVCVSNARPILYTAKCTVQVLQSVIKETALQGFSRFFRVFRFFFLLFYFNNYVIHLFITSSQQPPILKYLKHLFLESQRRSDNICIPIIRKLNLDITSRIVPGAQAQNQELKSLAIVCFHWNRSSCSNNVNNNHFSWMGILFSQGMITTQLLDNLIHSSFICFVLSKKVFIKCVQVGYQFFMDKGGTCTIPWINFRFCDTQSSNQRSWI